jgi:hypothetical protein
MNRFVVGLALLVACGTSEEPAGAAKQAASSEDGPASGKKKGKSKKKGKGKRSKSGGGAADGALTVDSPITTANWKGHPYVVQVRETVSSIEKNLGGGPFYAFSDGCGGEGIYKVGLGELKASPDAPSAEGPVRKFYLEEGGGDSARDTVVYYDNQDRALFAYSVFSHASAGSKATSRVYYRDGKQVFEAPVEMKAGELGGPQDSVSLPERVPATTADAFQKMSKTAGKCGE